jgi:2,4-dienoyl-CoA reductase (NADPH2)
VVGVGRFKDPLQAERAIAEGHCDLVGVVRGQIADPDFAAKGRAGATDEIRLCLSCNQECVGRMGLNRWLGCIENPRTGREAEGVGTVHLVPRPKNVMIVGAGPAGLECALSLGRRGYRVTLVEGRNELGGRVALEAKLPGLGEWRRVLQDCLGLSRDDFGPNSGIVLFERSEALVERADRLEEQNELPFIVIDAAERAIDISVLQFPLWLAFAGTPMELTAEDDLY